MISEVLKQFTNQMNDVVQMRRDCNTYLGTYRLSKKCYLGNSLVINSLECYLEKQREREREHNLFLDNK